MERIYFGLNTPDGTVSDAQWNKFLAKVVTPRFPEGLTVIQGRGQWLGANSKIAYEESRILELVHDDSPEHARAILEITSANKSQFQQEAVMIVRTDTNVCF